MPSIFDVYVSLLCSLYREQGVKVVGGYDHKMFLQTFLLWVGQALSRANWAENMFVCSLIDKKSYNTRLLEDCVF